MNLNRLMVGIGILALVLGIAIACLWQFAWTPPGRVKNIFSIIRGEKYTPRALLNSCGLAPQEPEARSFACGALWKVGPDALPTVIEGLGDEDSRVRCEAALCCGHWKDRRAIKPLIAALHDPDPGVRGAVIMSLDEIADPEAGPALRQAMKDTEPSVRFYVPRTIGECWGKPAIPTLVEALEDSQSSVQLQAALALARLGDDRGLTILKKNMDKDYVVQAVKDLMSKAASSQPASHATR